MIYVIQDMVIYEPTTKSNPLWAFKKQDLTLIFYIEDEGLECFLLCMLGFILQWEWPLWVRA